jgi:hypothetical protein
VASSRAAIGGASLVRGHCALLGRAIGGLDGMLADAIGKVKTARGDRPLIAADGGSVLVPDDIPGSAR